VLRPYQAECLAAIQNAITRGRKRQLIVLPTAAGKTVIFTRWIALHPGERWLILVHRDELVTQTLSKLADAAPWLLADGAVGVIKAERNDVAARVIVASVQTLARPNRLAQLGPVDGIIVDEAHHATAETYKRILAACGAYYTTGPLVLGWTATADRADGEALGAVFEAIVYEQPMLALHGIQVKLAAEFHDLHISHGDFKPAELGALLADADAPVHAAAAYREHAEDRTGSCSRRPWQRPTRWRPPSASRASRPRRSMAPRPSTSATPSSTASLAARRRSSATAGS